MKHCISCGQSGVFIPDNEFEKGLWLTEEQKIVLQEKILENDKLIQSLKEDLNLSDEEE